MIAQLWLPFIIAHYALSVLSQLDEVSNLEQLRLGAVEVFYVEFLDSFGRHISPKNLANERV